MPAAAVVGARMMWAMRLARFRHAPTFRNGRRRQRGQGMVEFALVAPVFFFVIFAMIDGGFLLFSVNAVDQATTIGSNSIAALGRVSDADLTSLQRMAASSSLGATSLMTISEIDVEELATNSTKDGFNVVNGSPVVQADCGPSDDMACINRYTFTGAGSNPTISLLNGNVFTPECASGDPSGCPPWPPSTRDVYNGESSFVGLKVTYTYTFFTGVAGTAHLSTTKTFRLEPQNAPGT